MQPNRSGAILVSISRRLPTRQTLRVCVQRDSGSPSERCLTILDPLKAAKRYARNGFVRSRGVQETFKNQLNIKLFVAWRTSLSCPGRQTCVGVRPGDVVCTFADTIKANNILGWKSELSLKEALASAWKWEKKIRAK